MSLGSRGSKETSQTWCWSRMSFQVLPASVDLNSPPPSVTGQGQVEAGDVEHVRVRRLGLDAPDPGERLGGVDQLPVLGPVTRAVERPGDGVAVPVDDGDAAVQGAVVGPLQSPDVAVLRQVDAPALLGPGFSGVGRLVHPAAHVGDVEGARPLGAGGVEDDAGAGAGRTVGAGRKRSPSRSAVGGHAHASPS
jgi:hypothetical protein